MTTAELQLLKEWFEAYVLRFSSDAANDEDRQNISLKHIHSHEVCGHAGRLAQALKIGEGNIALAEAVGLLHDTGRFKQYRLHKTFDDAVSENHAALGIGALRENGILHNLSGRDEAVILKAVGLHNVFSVPAGLDDEVRLFVKIIRDADKIDIYRVFMEYFAMDEKERSPIVALGLSNSPEYSEEVLSCLMNGTMAPKSLLRTQTDFKLMQLSWVYDLNFVESIQILAERDAFKSIASQLPQTAGIKDAIHNLERYIEHKMRSGFSRTAYPINTR